jgi:hypothetical protein
LVTFADRLLVHLSEPANLVAFLGGMDLGTFFTADFQARFNSEFWQIAQVAVGATRTVSFEQPTWVETRLLGREDHHGNAHSKTQIDYKVYGKETAQWTDLLVDLDTTWLVDQFPGTVVTSEAAPPTFEGLANLVSVLRIDAGNHPLDASGAPLANITLDNQGRLQTDPPNPITLTLDPLAGALLQPNGAIQSLVLLELFPRVGPVTPLLGAPLGEDGQPLRNLRMDNHGSFTDLTGTPATIDPLTGLPLNGDSQPVRPARLTIPDSGTTDYRFTFTLPVQTDRLTLMFVTRLHLFVRSEFNLIDDLRLLLALRHRLEQRHDYLLSLNDTSSKRPHIFTLVYQDNVLAGNGLTQDDVRRLGARMNILIHFFALP